MICAIHQPNFFPWLGYFRKIARADVFVFLDAVPFPRTSRGTWVNRVKLLVSGRPQWVTCPIRRDRKNPGILDVRIDETQAWRKKLLRSLEMSYGKAPCFVESMSWIAPMIENPLIGLADYNISNVRETADRLGLRCRFVRQSELQTADVFKQKGSERLAAICREVGATTYLAGDGAEEYEDLSVYERAGLQVVRNCFRAVPYPQMGAGEFVPGLSVLDALLNVGERKTAGFLASETYNPSP